MDTIPVSLAQILPDFIPHMNPGPRHLSLSRDSERLERTFESYPYLLPTFAGLRSLKTLGITVLGERCHEMMRTLQSELIFASIQLPPTSPLDLSAHAASHPILMLKQSAASPTELSHCDCLFDASPELTFSPQKVVYPKLPTPILRLCERFTLNPIPQAFIRAFPNHVSFHMESAPPRRGLQTRALFGSNGT